MRVAARIPAHLFTDTVSVERKSAATANGRYPSESWSAAITGMKCAIQPMTTAEAMKFGTDRAMRMVNVYTSPANDVQSEDRLAFTDSRTGSAVTRYYAVVSTPSDLVSGGAVLELACEEIGGVR